jgi:hypothetical protein
VGLDKKWKTMLSIYEKIVLEEITINNKIKELKEELIRTEAKRTGYSTHYPILDKIEELKKEIYGQECKMEVIIYLTEVNTTSK